MSEELLRKFDSWLKDDGPAALVLREYLMPVEGKDAVIFPPTYAKPERMKEEDWTGYNIDPLGDGASVCQLDSVGSQANRMEPIFKSETHKHLVPQVTVKAGEREINLLDAGHRAADAIVHFSNGESQIHEAFQEYAKGNAGPLARLAPTSFVFGAWDSRGGTGVKLPRIVRSVIRAYNVRRVHRSAQYAPPVDYVGDGLLSKPEDKKQQEAMSEMGLSHAPAAWTHGGVLVQGEIRREAIVNLVVLRSLQCKEKDGGDASLNLRCYILGLSLVAFTAPQSPALREGCELVRDPEKEVKVELVYANGKRQPYQLTPEDALKFAQEAALKFVIRQPERPFEFNPKEAKEELAKSDKERKAKRRGGNVVPESQGSNAPGAQA